MTIGGALLGWLLVNGALVTLLALGGILAGFLGAHIERWEREGDSAGRSQPYMEGGINTAREPTVDSVGSQAAWLDGSIPSSSSAPTPRREINKWNRALRQHQAVLAARQRLRGAWREKHDGADNDAGSAY